MKFSTRTELRVPVDYLFGAIADMERLGQALRSKGVKIDGPADAVELQAGQKWQASFPYRGKSRNLTAMIAELSKPDMIVVDSATSGLESRCEIELGALSPDKTRLRISVELRPKTMSARLFLQSLKLVKARADQKFVARVRTYLFDIERGFGAGGG